MKKPDVDTNQFGDTETLRAWAQDIEREIAEITAAMVPLQERLDAAREKLDLVRRLIHLLAPARSRPAAEGQLPQSSPDASPPAIEDRIEEVLQAAGAPLHIKELREALIEAGAPLPGKGDEANIILRVRRAPDRFVRTGRGTYGLVAWNLPEYHPTPRKRKKSQRQGRSAS